MSKDNFKITGLKSLPKDHEGKPLVITIIITDVNNDRYESEIHMDNGYQEDGFREACCASFMFCDAEPKEVNVQSVKIRK